MAKMMRRRTYETFAQRVARLRESTPDGQCLVWDGWTNKRGYGMVNLDGRCVSAHRMAWEAAHGPIPQGLVVRHLRCRNTHCVNVEHLAIGTQKDNGEDMVRDGMSTMGIVNACAKLTEPHVRVIRYLWRHGSMSQHAMSRLFGVSQPAIRNVLIGKTWAHVAGNVWTQATYSGHAG